LIIEANHSMNNSQKALVAVSVPCEPGPATNDDFRAREPVSSMDARSALRFRARDPFWAPHPPLRAMSFAEPDARYLVRVRWRSGERRGPPFDAGLVSARRAVTDG
jgi:hypothetical protein